MEEIRLYDIDLIEFSGLIDTARVELKNNNSEYKELKNKVSEIMEMYPNLQLIFEDDKAIKLNEEECKMLQKLVSIYLQMSDYKEEELLKRKSKEAGLSEAEFIRSLIKGYRIKAQPTEEIKSFQRDLYGIANNINQIARVANSRYSVSHDDYKYISNTLADFILRFERKIYSRQK